MHSASLHRCGVHRYRHFEASFGIPAPFQAYHNGKTKISIGTFNFDPAVPNDAIRVVKHAEKALDRAKIKFWELHGLDCAVGASRGLLLVRPLRMRA